VFSYMVYILQYYVFFCIFKIGIVVGDSLML
jgi:hypothetical protein